MIIPLEFWDLSLWLAMIAIILLITLGLLAPKYDKSYLTINYKRLKNTALAVSVLFLITVAIRIIGIALTP